MTCKHCKKPIHLSAWGYYFHADTGLRYGDDGKHQAEPETEQ